MAALVVTAAAWVHIQSPENRADERRTRLDAVEGAELQAGRSSRKLPPPTVTEPDQVTTTTDPANGADTRASETTPVAQRNSRSATNPGRSVGLSSDSAGLGQSGLGVSPVAPDASTSPGDRGSIWLPGTDSEAPIIGPVTNLPGDPDEDLVRNPNGSPEPETPATDPEEPETLDEDELGCPNLGLLPIGGFSADTDAALTVLYPKFRALAYYEFDNPDLVCAHPLEPWRDMVVQRLVTAGADDGAIITAADGSSIAMRLTRTEWDSYRFRYGGGPVGPNLLGFPVERLNLAGTAAIRTTGGGLVFSVPGGLGLPVIGGLWDFWMSNGGPEGHMGLPMGIPESATGPMGQTTWAPGDASSGARQSFTNGWVFLPGVISDLDAAAQPADRYQWHPWSDVPPTPEPSIDYRGHIVKLGPTTWYVDKAGVRHWIPNSSAWMCAKWDLGAAQYLVEANELDAYPLGSEFVCNDYKQPKTGAG